MLSRTTPQELGKNHNNSQFKGTVYQENFLKIYIRNLGREILISLNHFGDFNICYEMLITNNF